MLPNSGYGVQLMSRMLTGITTVTVIQMRTMKRRKMKMRMLAKRTLMEKEKIMKKRKMRKMKMRMKRVVDNVRLIFPTRDATDM